MRRFLPLFGILLLSACASNPAPRLWDDPRMQTIKKLNRPAMPLAVAVAPVELGFDPASLKMGDKARHVIATPLSTLGRQITSMVKELGCFGSVSALPREKDNSVDAALSRAWERGADLLLRVKLRKYENSWEGSNGYYLPNLLLWATFVFPAWWVADEKYGSTVELDAELISVHSQKVVARHTLKAETVRELDDFDRGWQALGILRVPGSLDGENWEKISEVVSPYPLTDVKVQLAKLLTETFRKTSETRAFSEKMSKTLLISVGLSRFDSYKLHNLRFAASDAKAFHEMFTGGENPIVPLKNAMLLTNQQATAENLRKTLEAFVLRRARADDRVILYFSGYGGVGPGRKGSDAYLLPYDFSEKTGLAKSALSFAYIKDVLERCAAGRILLLVDAGFSGRLDGRSFAEGDTEGAGEALRSLGGRQGAAVLFAADAGQKALEFEDRKRGLFSFYLFDGLAGKADKNLDGAVMLEELAAHLKENVAKRAGLAGETQTVVLAGQLANMAVSGKKAEKTPEKKPEDTSEKATETTSEKK